MSDRIFVELEHVHNPNSSDPNAIKLRTLVHTGSDQQASVRASMNRDSTILEGLVQSYLLPSTSVLVVDKPFSSGVEIVKHILFFLLLSGFVPSLSIFTSEKLLAYDSSNCTNPPRMLATA